MIAQKYRKREWQKWNNIYRCTQRAPFELCLRVLVSALFLIIFLLFTSLDTSGTQDTYLAPLGLDNFILAKNWSQDPLFLVTSFLSILSTSSEFSTGHAFYLFKLIFSVVTSFVLLSEGKISKKEKEEVKELKKIMIAQKQRKKSGKTRSISRGAHRERHLSCVYVCWFPPCS